MPDDGGPLFMRSGDKEVCRLSVRDWFAGMALIGLIASNRLAGDGKSDARCECDLEANIAFEYADSMLVHRAKSPDSPLWGEQTKE